MGPPQHFEQQASRWAAPLGRLLGRREQPLNVPTKPFNLVPAPHPLAVQLAQRLRESAGGPTGPMASAPTPLPTALRQQQAGGDAL